jgi:hypothetical protein
VGAAILDGIHTFLKLCIKLSFGNGWYRGSCGAWGLKNQYGIRTKILAQLELTYTNGVKNVIVTDDSWDWCNDGTDHSSGELWMETGNRLFVITTDPVCTC